MSGSGEQQNVVKCLLCQQDTQQSHLENLREYRQFKLLETMYKLHVNPPTVSTMATQTDRGFVDKAIQTDVLALEEAQCRVR
jgi:hypothetical protein